MRDILKKVDDLTKKNVSIPDVTEKYGSLLEKDKIFRA